MGEEESSSGCSEEDSNYIKLDSARIFQDYALNLAREGKFQEALSLYAVSAKQCGPNTKVISDVGEIMINQYISSLSKHRKGMATDPWSCCACAGILIEPVTLNCGHSSCKKCILKDLKELCKKCGVKYRAREDDPANDCEYIKTSILVSDLVKKYWSKELQAVDLRNEGNKLFQRGDVKGAIQRYTEAYVLAENDHLLTSNRSHAFYKLGDYTSALADAEKTIVLRPDWGKGYFRKGMALKALGKADKALVAFFECLLFEETISKPLKTDIYHSLSSFINQLIESAEPLGEASASEPDFREAISSIVSATLEQAGGDGATSHDRYNVAGRVPPEGRESPAPQENKTTTTNLSSSSTKLENTTTKVTSTTCRRPETAAAGADDCQRSETDSRLEAGDKKLLVPRNQAVNRLLSEIEMKMEELINIKFKPANRDIDPKAVDANDFECSLCFRLLWQPVTTICGHTYCKACLDRSLDHRNECPLCKTKIIIMNEQLGVNDFVDQTIRRMLPSEYLDRQRIYEEEIADLGTADRKDGRVEVPVFVCTMSFPNIPCPLHVFEPRYRLMIRRAMESGAREFGMCVNDQARVFAEYGTMLEIRDIQYFADGRSVVDTMGSRRFHVLERGTRDGYNTAVVEFLKDDIVEGEELTELRSVHDRTRALAVSWFGDMDRAVQMNVTSHYGPMPRVETEYWKLSSGPAWAWWVLAILPLDTLAQQQILSQTKLKRRLEAIGRILGYIKRRGGVPA